MFTLLALVFFGVTTETGAIKSIQSGGETRDYILYDPVGTSSSPKRLILAFHGFRQKAAELEKDIGLNTIAKKEGLVVIYPLSLGDGWNAGRCCGAADDIGFIDALIKTEAINSKIDPKHVYVMGMSNGGMMAYRLAAERSSQVAAAAIVGGSMEVPPSSGAPVPILHIHGTNDRIVRFDGGEGDAGFTPAHSTSTIISNWVRLNGCKTPPRQTILASGQMQVTRDDYPAGPAGAEVVLITVQDGGHMWPGVKNPTVDPKFLPILGITNNDVNATELIVTFFKSL